MEYFFSYWSGPYNRHHLSDVWSRFINLIHCSECSQKSFYSLEISGLGSRMPGLSSIMWQQIRLMIGLIENKNDGISISCWSRKLMDGEEGWSRQRLSAVLLPVIRLSVSVNLRFIPIFSFLPLSGSFFLRFLFFSRLILFPSHLSLHPLSICHSFLSLTLSGLNSSLLFLLDTGKSSWYIQTPLLWHLTKIKVFPPNKGQLPQLSTSMVVLVWGVHVKCWY